MTLVLVKIHLLKKNVIYVLFVYFVCQNRYFCFYFFFSRTKKTSNIPINNKLKNF